MYKRQRCSGILCLFLSVRETAIFAELFARQAVKDGRNVIYIRFTQHAPVLKDLTGITVREFDPDDGFETFTVGIHEEITRQEKIPCCSPVKKNGQMISGSTVAVIGTSILKIEITYDISDSLLSLIIRDVSRA